jgi:hypothetical protein
MKKMVFVLLAALSLCACEKVYDSSYYEANCKVAETVVEKCKSGEASGDNCTNASQGLSRYKSEALNDYIIGKTKTMPNGTCQ